MPLQFTRAHTPKKGDPITSAQMRSLARACNDRTLSGIGDAAWRQAQLWFNNFRLPRNPSEDGLTFPAMGEFFEVFQHILPEMGQWPLSPPGEPEGANLANLMNQFVFGLAPYLNSEPDRLSEHLDEDGILAGLPLWLSSGPADTPDKIWELAKLQRGAIDPETFAQAVPALDTAQKFMEISAPIYSPHGKSYGGFFPTPVELLDSCGTTEDTGLYTQSYEYFWTALSSDTPSTGFHGSLSTVDGKPRVTYAGSCPLGSDYTAAGHVVYILPLPFAWYVAVNDGAGGYHWDRFDRTQWIIGPFEGNGVLSREDSLMLHRALWQFAADFRGSRTQRENDDFDIEKIAFEFQAFSEAQYHLAPNIARFSGGALEPLYPFFQLIDSGLLPKGTQIPLATGPASHAYHPGFCLTAFKVRTKGLTGSTTIELLDNGKVFYTAQITGADSNDTHQIFTLGGSSSARPAPILSVRLAAPAQLSGRIEVETNEILEYKPNYWDFYLILRMATGGAGGLAGSGLDYDLSREIWDAYKANGCLVNTGAAGLPPQPDWVNDNPVFDAARRLSRDHIRILSRRQFRSYSVVDGKSVLRFYRHVRGAMGLAEDTADCFENLAPSKTAVEPGALNHGEEYIVRGTSGEVTYKGVLYGPSQRFVCDRSAIFNSTGDCQVFVFNGIRPAAFPKGWSNRWCMFQESKVAAWDEASELKPEAYADFFPFHQRCHFKSVDSANAAFRRHVTWNHRVTVASTEDGSGFTRAIQSARAQTDFYIVEAPSGYNYALGANHTYSDEPFYKSCQIYKAPYEIESAVIEFEDGIELVKLTFTGRFQAHEDAPASVAADPLSWDGAEKTALQDEDYRTDDNALREYALHLADSAYAPTIKIGDRAAGASISDVWGCVFPHFFFVHLVPEPFEDGNNRLDSSDTRCLIDAMLHAEIAIRAMCEGFVDDKTSVAITCQTGQGSLYDYKFDNLCFDAFSGTNIGAFSLAIRPDRPPGFGPLPNTWMYAEVFSRLAAAVNLLDRARVMLPFHVECQSWPFARSRNIVPNWPSPAPTCAEGAGSYHVVWHGCPDKPDIQVCDTPPCDPPPWEDCGLTVQASSGAFINPEQCPGTPGEYLLSATRSVVNYRVKLDTGYEFAIPEVWRDEIQSIGGFVALFSTLSWEAHCLTTTVQLDANGCCSGYQNDNCANEFWNPDAGEAGEGWKDCWDPNILENVEECRLINSGQIDPGTPPCGNPFVGAHNEQDPPVRCYNTSGRTITAEVLTDPGFYVQIPLVDLE